MTRHLQGFEPNESTDNILGTSLPKLNVLVVGSMRAAADEFIEASVGTTVRGTRVRTTTGKATSIRFETSFRTTRNNSS
jgi:hypothetical protein